MKKTEIQETLDFIIVASAEAQKDIIETLKELKSEAKCEVVYIAGKVTGLPYPAVAAKFLQAQLELEAKGYVVVNPCALISKNEDWHTAMKICFSLMHFADHIKLLHDWQDSKGATMEKLYADNLGINILSA